MNVTATLFGQMITFGVLIWFVNQFLWDPITKMMEERRKKIADGLAAAERGRHELELAQKKSTDSMREAKQQTAELMTQAQKRADQLVEEAKEKAREEGQRQLELAQTEIEQEKQRAKEQLREQFASLVMQTAEKVLEKEINAAAHAEYVQKAAEKL